MHESSSSPSPQSTPEALTGVVFNVMRYCVHDGPGIRTTVFLKGCPLHCSWCHNPEGQRSEVEFSFREDRCVRCGNCFAICPNDAIEKRGDRYLPVRDHCESCGECTSTCYSEAREQVGVDMTVDDLMKEILKDRPFYDQSGGGVTFSGGEPLLHAEFLRAALEACREYRIHTAVETTGFCSQETFASVLPLADLYLYDLKLMDSEAHRRFTGVGNERILENLETLCRSGKPVIVRMPVIPGVNDHEANIQAMIQYLQGRTSINTVHLLPYHEFGKEKAHRIGMDVPSLDSGPVPEVRMNTIVEEFRRAGFSVAIGG
ncbi:MAG: glycyl-radical enzyme activating protein [Bacteroidota bacterium]